MHCVDRLRVLTIFMIGALFSTGVLAQTDGKAVVISAINEITGVCESKGMLACEPRIRGITPVFDAVRIYQQNVLDDETFRTFVPKKYGSNRGFHFDVVAVTMNFTQAIAIHPEQFTNHIEKVLPAGKGYDFTLTGGSTYNVHREQGVWILAIPASGGDTQQMQQLARMNLPVQLKHSILTYRMLEADMAHLGQDALETGVNQDLAADVLAYFPNVKVRAILKWQLKNPNAVLEFYRQFASEADMKKYIAKQHHLKQ